MAKHVKAGISLTGGFAQIAVVQFHNQTVDLLFLNEIEKQKDNEIWFMDILNTVDSKTLGKISEVSVCLDDSLAFIHGFPVDSTLSQSDKLEQIHWEFSNYISDYQSSDYINDIHTLRVNVKQQMMDILTVAVKRQLVFSIENYIKGKKYHLGTIELNQFAARNMLFYSFPEAKDSTCVLLGITPSRLDIGIYGNGKLVDHHYRIYKDITETQKYLYDLLTPKNPLDIYIYGTATTPEWSQKLSEICSQQIVVLNPFRKLRIGESCANYDKYTGQEYKFAACLGCSIKN